MLDDDDLSACPGCERAATEDGRGPRSSSSSSSSTLTVSPCSDSGSGVKSEPSESRPYVSSCWEVA